MITNCHQHLKNAKNTCNLSKTINTFNSLYSCYKISEHHQKPSNYTTKQTMGVFNVYRYLNTFNKRLQLPITEHFQHKSISTKY